MKWSLSALGIYSSFPSKMRILSHFSNRRFSVMSHGPGLSYVSIIVKSVHSILLATVVVPTPKGWALGWSLHSHTG